MTEQAPWDQEGDGWAAFLEGTADRPPLPFFHQALDWTGEGGGRQVIDLGCGGGAETLAFLERGWKVLATDASPRAERLLKDRVDPTLAKNLEVVIGRFEEVDLPQADLVYAQMSLPFAGVDFGPAVDNALGAVKTGGAFVGHFFGHNDDWIDGVNVIAVDRDWIETRFRGWTDLEIEEVDSEGPFGSEGGTKHWHFYFVKGRR